MRVFFLSEKTCVLSVNGLFLGTVDGFERTVELEPADGVFCELMLPGYHALRFRFDETFLTAPPEQVSLYYTKAGVAIYAAGFLREDASLRPVRQERLAGTLLTLYVQGRVQLSLENEMGFHIIDLPDAFEVATMSQAGDYFLLETAAAFLLLTRKGEIVVRAEGHVIERGERVTADVPFRDSLRHTAVCTWEKGKLTDCRIRTSSQPTEATYALALFESVLIGADPSPYLSKNLAEKAHALGEYLGKFTSVVLTERTDEVGLVYERKTRVFDLRYFRVTLGEDGKITNIAPLE
ncbi:MAG: hypothetical protein IKD43_00810 [Clostridia bacterium]|nr:hypothetical protein [Clostridia bacterium]